MITIKEVILFLIALILLISSAAAKDCPEDTYLRVHPETKVEACCITPKDCVNEEGICIKCPRCENVIYENKFDEWTEDMISFGGNWGIEQDIQPNGLLGNVLVQNDAYGNAELWVGNPQWSDYTVEIRAKIKSASYSDVIGIQYGMYKPEEYYEYRINNRVIRRKKIGIRPETIELSPPKATTCNKLNKWCKIKIKTFEGKDRIFWTRVYVNDIEVYNTSIGEARGLSQGRIALKTYSAVVQFDNLIISETEWQKDRDLDEIPNRCDYCDNTPYGCLIYNNGCPVDLNNDGKCDTILEVLYDLDKDGYISEEVGGDDCDDYDENVNPGAIEICNNNRDDDCNRKIDCDDEECEIECFPEEEVEEILEEEVKKGFFQKILDWLGQKLGWIK